MPSRTRTSGQPPRPAPAPRFERRGPAVSTGVREASDATTLPGDVFLVVSDLDDRFRLVSPNAGTRPKRYDVPGVKNGESSFEAVAFDPDTSRLFVAREARGEVLRLRWSPADAKDPLADGVLPSPGGRNRNKGPEGLCFLPAPFSPTGAPALLLAQEGDPRQLWLMDPDGAQAPLAVELPDALLERAQDFSALAVDPLTGHVFVGSDESATAVELVLSKTADGFRAEVCGVTALVDEKGAPLSRVEGLTFDRGGTLWALTENDGRLHPFRRTGAGG